MQNNNRTINGQPFNQVMKEFRKNFAYSDFKKDFMGRKYIPIDKVVDRLNKVLGLNYSFEIKTIQHVQIGNNHAFIPTAIFAIVDDNGKLITKTSSTKGKNVIFPTIKQGNKRIPDYSNPKDIADDAASAGSMALKKCCKNLGMPITDTQCDQEPPVDNQKVYNLTINSAFSTSNKCIKVNVINRDTNKTRDLIIWNNQKATLGEDRISKMLKCRVGTAFEAYVEETEYKGIPQYTLKALKSPKKSPITA
ncbi:hypothetical protein [Vallitalea guaymasensis]|uniref:hypothetical protein n=1 Tax=Vallitalea guaymasensis TaxID=1185412 RepID=UPI000DE2AB1A|nr:hypothetical protein [Vallitalea guaymasensis]